ncbi:MAG: 16S rRNA (guanine(966)-N(2))-methyltransferase RsmD [Clostridia bacterium]|nr:16S rRNA (guanine(966)-N(2))-methyltransferase RsmD [Clostridia bacterium]
MRVITGSARGRRLKTLSGDEVRPTSDLVKEAVFSIIQFSVEGRKFLDLFAGSGQMAIEALSRGASSAVLVDASKQSCAVIRDNLKTTGFDQIAQLVQSDAAGYIARCRENFDIAYIDPPYESGLIKKVLPGVCEHMNMGGTVLCESNDTANFPESAGDFVLCKTYRYGRIFVALYRHGEMDA